jgi:CBS domain-containing membrane protein
MKVRDLMATDVETVERNDELSVAEDLMQARRVRHLPVLEEGRLVGILTHRDLLHAALSSAMGYGQKAAKEFLGTIAVKEVMTDDVVTIGPDETAKRAAELMLEHKVGCLPVLDKTGKLLGLITESDLLRVVAGLDA